MRSILTDAQAIRIAIVWFMVLLTLALSVDLVMRGANMHHSLIVGAVAGGIKVFLDFKKAKAAKKEDDECSKCQS